tara:strand:- start:2879 stop:3463 length:585 start_codon:yes stop_codon:yes gene_type:complete
MTKLYSVSFPRTGTHFIGANLSRFYDAEVWVRHDPEGFAEQNVISIVRDPRTNIASYIAHHMMRLDKTLNDNHTVPIAEQSAKDYLDYYLEAQKHPHVIFADFTMMTNNFIRFADTVGEIFSLPKSYQYETAEVTRDDHKDDEKAYLPTVAGSPIMNKIYEALGDVDLSKHYELYNENLGKAKQNGLLDKESKL